MTLTVHSTSLEKVFLIEPEKARDITGTEETLFQAVDYASYGMQTRFVSERLLKAKSNTLQGLYYQKSGNMGLLMTPIDGQVSIIACDIRSGSQDFGEWVRVDISPDQPCQMYIGPGMAFGFYAKTDALILAKQTAYDDANDFGGIFWNDQDLNIQWPHKAPIVSARDALFPTLQEINDTTLPKYTQTQVPA